MVVVTLNVHDVAVKAVVVPDLLLALIFEPRLELGEHPVRLVEIIHPQGLPRPLAVVHIGPAIDRDARDEPVANRALRLHVDVRNLGIARVDRAGPGRVEGRHRAPRLLFGVDDRHSVLEVLHRHRSVRLRHRRRVHGDRGIGFGRPIRSGRRCWLHVVGLLPAHLPLEIGAGGCVCRPIEPAAGRVAGAGLRVGVGAGVDLVRPLDRRRKVSHEARPPAPAERARWRAKPREALRARGCSPARARPRWRWWW